MIVRRGTGRPEAYRTADGTRVPSVTTITGARKSGVEGLLVWANRLGMGESSPEPACDKCGRKPGQSHKDVRQQAADAGSMCHAMIENHIHNRDPWEGINPLDEKTNAQAQQGFESFVDWSQVMHVSYLETETPLVSQKHRYGGTPDAIGVVGNRLSLMDWKSSNAVYGDYLVQLAAYQQLWNETHPAPIQSVYLLRVGKEHGDFHVHSYPPTAVLLGWEAFLHLRELYDLDSKLKKVAS